MHGASVRMWMMLISKNWNRLSYNFFTQEPGRKNFAPYFPLRLCVKKFTSAFSVQLFICSSLIFTIK
jgi:hypothetical protein